MKLRYTPTISNTGGGFGPQWMVDKLLHREDGPNKSDDTEFYDLGGEEIFRRPLTKTQTKD